MTLSPGSRLGPYEILSAIGSGGMGEVWKARDTRLGRIMAIKKVKEQHSERFKQEARSIAALNHPNICQIHDMGDDYLVLEYVEGKPLSSPLPEQSLRRQSAQHAVYLLVLVALHPQEPQLWASEKANSETFRTKGRTYSHLEAAPNTSDTESSFLPRN